MSGFSSQWLTSREPIDRQARNPEILAQVANHFRDQQKVVIADIGSGTGSTLRAMSGTLAGDVHWHLFDNDPELLAFSDELNPGNLVESHETDLSSSLAAVFQNDPDLVTTSAFLDLVSHDWISRLANELASRRIPFYASLSYDGRAKCEPPHSADADLFRAFNRHQETDKGFGPALGPMAVAVTIKELKDVGFQVFTGHSDWVADGQYKTFQELLLEGWHAAACELDAVNSARFDDWLMERLAHIHTGQLEVQVGHQDIFAIPAM